MRTRTAVILCLLGATVVASDLPRPPRAWELIVGDRALLKELGRMGRMANSRSNQTEAAAFVVREADDALSLVAWPDQWKRHRQSYRGPIPPGVIAIVHTHPDARSPVPSHGDGELARRTRLPVVALSRWAIWVIEPDAEKPVPLVSRRNWTADGEQLAVK